MSTFPLYSKADILSFQFSSWYPTFSNVSIKSIIVRPLAKEFVEYLHEDGVFVPEGSEAPTSGESETDPDDDWDEDEDDDDDDPRKQYSFPDLDQKIRNAIQEYGSVFPKLNFSSPRDAFWILTAGSPLKCTSPADVYILLKSSDFISHDLSTETVFEGCEPKSEAAEYDLELVLRKWYAMDRSREMRCFVKDNRFIGISQRDRNFYNFLNNTAIQTKIISTLHKFWKDKIVPKWSSTKDYVFDILLTRDLSRAHIVDFNPYAPKTDVLLFTYDDLLSMSLKDTEEAEPELRVIGSRSHPAATSTAPEHQHNMVPIEALSLSQGATVEEFEDNLKQEILESMKDEDGA